MLGLELFDSTHSLYFDVNQYKRLTDRLTEISFFLSILLFLPKYFHWHLVNCLREKKPYIVKLGNSCALKLEKATKASFMGFFSSYLSPIVHHGQDCIKTQAYGIKI